MTLGGPFGPSDVTVSCGGGLGPYAPAGLLGLFGGPGCGGPPACDAIDALSISEVAGSPFSFDPGDQIWFSLAPGSPSLLAAFPMTPSPADIFKVNAANGPFPFVAYTGDQLGLNSSTLGGVTLRTMIWTH